MNITNHFVHHILIEFIAFIYKFIPQSNRTILKSQEIINYIINFHFCLHYIYI